jgi:hypothetical protein
MDADGGDTGGIGGKREKTGEHEEIAQNNI